MNNIQKSWNKEYSELFEVQYNDLTTSYDEDMMCKEIEHIIGE